MDNQINSLTLPSPAKLNLFLHIIGRKENGYHLLETLFQFIDLHDTIRFTVNREDHIRIFPHIEALPEKDNLIFKAATLLQPFRRNKESGVHIHLEKSLPMGAGIGGGSSNAATTLLALNLLWDCQLSLSQLASLGLSLGADVPIFIHGKSAFAQGVGEQLTFLRPKTPVYLLVKPNAHVNTGQIFTDKRLTRDTSSIKISHVLTLDGHNDCLDVVRDIYPDVNEAYLWLKNQGDVKLTGTGACLFIAFEHIEDAERVKQELPEKWQAWICNGSNTSLTHQVLDQWVAKNRKI
ncbi:4-(cytidine 5'-diphospho)-2-C-methyl-D-erythritol kinase [Marinomonas sp. 15G1-11]|uniref:4-diphosphocytidyl-2-C-methyl-D-erythritol kinase n=1 Tax=Marinomonas phaeophyticola TaxID=3004091 RepID=A0ABT4JQG1_9GAMM|nr:4-(cytidine 5'-diphospho)-2-C-methyl-D-erythritol kinase [Marinomonas sp. 15G1-11]MCZ2720605.1 4-(cytidine 5'-diphospho)-2-C-methyl-D-erythritol kinase [Marinomonas sp. 15G1-11]